MSLLLKCRYNKLVTWKYLNYNNKLCYSLVNTSDNNIPTDNTIDSSTENHNNVDTTTDTTATTTTSSTTSTTTTTTTTTTPASSSLLSTFENSGNDKTDIHLVSRGKKIKPQKPNIVVLNLKQSGLLPNTRKYNYNRNKKISYSNRMDHSNDNISNNTTNNNNHYSNYINSANSNSIKHITILEGVDLGDNTNSNYKNIDSNNEYGQNNSNNDNIIDDSDHTYLLDSKAQTSNTLLQFKSKLTNEQIIQSIDSMKPPTTEVSNKIYDELLKRLLDGYTVKQLRYYISTKSPGRISTSKLVKLGIVKRLLNDVWQLKISSKMNTLNSYSMSHKIVNLNDVQTKLLLLTQNGKILKNLSRLDKNLLIQLDYSNNQLKLWGNESVLKYIEISINNVLKNILMTKWMPSNDSLTSANPSTTSNTTTTTTYNNNNKIISRITRLCDVDINLDKNEICAFGNKRIQLAKRLMLWSDYLNMESSKSYSNYWKQSVDQIVSNNGKEYQFQWFPFVDIQTLNWLRQIEPHETLREICSIKNESYKQLPPTSLNNLLTDEKIDKFYDFFNHENKASVTDLEPNVSNILSISLGQILRSNTKPQLTSPILASSSSLQPNWIFHSRIPQLSQKLLKMPLFDEHTTNDELLSTDQHDYYLQIILTPNKNQFKDSINDNTFLKDQPLELWLQLDENNQIILDSIQAIIPTLRENYLIQTPERPFDYRISNDHVLNIEVTLKSQPGLISFLNEIRMSNSIDNIKIPSNLLLNNPSELSDTKSSVSTIGYNYVTCNRHKILKLKYMDKYCVQYSEIDGGNFGGKSQQIDFISNDSKPTKEEFRTFIKDIFKF